MTNNFDLYKEYVTTEFANSLLPENDTYFVIELMRRGKDNPDMPAANYHFKNYYIRKPEDLDKYRDEIIQLCDMFRMRAYASVNYKSFKQVTLNTLVELSRRVATNDFKKNYNVYESCSGSYVHSQNKRWVIDLDDCKMDDPYVICIEDYITDCKESGVNKIITRIPTRSGVHLISKPFYKDEFKAKCKNHSQIPDIKENHLTLLYENL